jgi:hypothetical protein
LIKEYEKKISQLDTSIYFNIQLHKTKYLIGGFNFLAISASRYYKNEKISAFLDTNRTFYRNGTLKHIQIQDSLGLVTEILQYDKLGDISNHCIIHRDSLDFGLKDYTYLLDNFINHCKKYKKGQLIFEGNYKGRKDPIGKHVWYNMDGTIKKQIHY